MPPTLQLLDTLLSVLETDILPLTTKGVAQGNKIFGAAVLRKDDYSLVVAATNEETQNPLLHGEVACLNAFWALPEAARPAPETCLFLSTHEPCSLCLSAITWSGFDNFYYLFSYEDSRDAFSIPHDLKILDEVFGCPNGAYQKSNAFWDSFSLSELIDQVPAAQREPFLLRLAALHEAYAELSEAYQKTKSAQAIPLR